MNNMNLKFTGVIKYHFLLLSIFMLLCIRVNSQVLFEDDFFKAAFIVPDSTMICTMEEVETPMGALTVKSCSSVQIVNNQKLKYAYKVIAYPPGSVHHDSLELLLDLFDETAQASAEAVLGELVYDSSLDLLEYPGYIWRISYDKGKGLIKSRAVVKNNHFFILKVDYPRTLSVVPEIDLFLNSFKFK